MSTMKRKMPVALKVILIVAAVFLGKVLISLYIYEIYHFPMDALSNYPSTQWKCEKLGIELYVDDEGIITGYYDNGTDRISLDVTARSATTWHSNYIECLANDEVLYFHCFYKKVDSGIFYVVIESKETTLETDGIADIVPYKFVKQS